MTTMPAPNSAHTWTTRRGVVAVAVAVLATLQAVLLLRTAWDKSDTADEGIYLAVSVLQWKGDLRANCESPALPKWGFGAALRLVDAELFDPTSRRGRDPLWSRRLPETRRNLMAARSATVIVTVLAGLCLFRAGCRRSVGVGLLAQTLWVGCPSVLASGSLATLDAWAASAAALALWLGLRLYERGTSLAALAVGAALGGGAACKVTVLGLVPVALGVIWLAARRAAPERILRRSALLAAAMLAGSLLALWAIYGFGISQVDTAQPCGKGEQVEGGGQFGPLPFAPWIEGLVVQLRHGQVGHRSYLFGRVSFEGWWWFYLAALALKTTLGAQALAAVRLSLLGRGVGRLGLGCDLLLAAYPALLIVVMSAGRTQAGIKYLLPAFPCGLLLLARALPLVSAAFPTWGRRLVLALVTLGTAESLAVHPHHLMFFNLWAGGPEGGPRYLVLGDDWGQDQRRLGEWQREQRPWRLYYTRYSGTPEHWGIRYEPPPCGPKIGFYALHAVEVHRPKRVPPGCLDWLTVEPPDARLGHSIYLYQVSKARIARLEAARQRGARPFWSSAGVLPDGPDQAP